MQDKNYSIEEVEKLLSLYKTDTDIETISTELSRSTRSVIAKLVQLGVYKKIDNKKARRLTKAELIAKIAEHTNRPLEDFDGLDKATWATINNLVSDICIDS